LLLNGNLRAHRGELIVDASTWKAPSEWEVQGCWWRVAVTVMHHLKLDEAGFLYGFYRREHDRL
jgi:hypothetical protein